MSADEIWSIYTTVALRTRSESNSRDHWRKKAARVAEQRNVVRMRLAKHVRDCDLTPPCKVTLTRFAPSNGLDDDNLRGALKAVRDGVADALGIDDRDARVRWEYEQRRAKPKAWAVGIRIEREGLT